MWIRKDKGIRIFDHFYSIYLSLVGFSYLGNIYLLIIWTKRSKYIYLFIYLETNCY